jgi:hypothetical protein
MMTNSATCSNGNGGESVAVITGHPKAPDFPASPFAFRACCARGRARSAKPLSGYPLDRQRFLNFCLALGHNCLLNRQSETQHRVCASKYCWSQWPSKALTKSRQEFGPSAQTLPKQIENKYPNKTSTPK